MSDDATQYWNSWINVFDNCGPFPKKLLCIWHIKRNWKINLRSKVDAQHQGLVKKRLDDLQGAETEAKFRVLVTTFKQELVNLGCVEFKNYFESNYIGTPFRQLEWALYARRESVVNTNTHLEAFHEVLKHNFLEGKQNRRLDVLIDDLLRMALSHAQDYRLMKESGLPASVHRLRIMHDRHDKSLGLMAKTIDSGWLVPSQSQHGRFYVVRKRLEGNCECQVKCRLCGVCADVYSCNCLDAVMRTTACKHMHAVHAVSNRPSATQTASTEATSSSLDVDCSLWPTPAVAQDLEEAKRMTKEDQLKNFIASMAEWSKDMPRLDFGTLDAINTKCKEISTLLKLSATTYLAPELSDESGPANKKIRRQCRF